MSESTNQSVTDQGKSGASTEDLTAKLPDDFKSDFFKHKERMKKAEEKAKEYERRIAEYELAEEEKKGNYQKVIEDLKEKSKKLEQELNQRDFTYASTNIDQALKMKAKELGCKDVNAFLKLIGKEKKDSISLMEDFSPIEDDIEMVVKDAMKEYEGIGLFGRNVNIVDRTPNNTPINKPSKKIGQMTKAELEQQLLNNYN